MFGLEISIKEPFNGGGDSRAAAVCGNFRSVWRDVGLVEQHYLKRLTGNAEGDYCALSAGILRMLS